MIEIVNRDTGKIVETICNEEDFRIDGLYIYSKDDFGQDVYWRRDYFMAVKNLNHNLKNIILY